jgi:hypothetical protein
MTVLRRQLIAFFLLAVLVMTGWFELVALAGQAYLREVRAQAASQLAEAPRVCAATAAASCPSHSTHKSTTRCAASCCKKGCHMGGDCRCGTAQPKAPVGALLLTRQGCHPTGPDGEALILPELTSLRVIFPASRKTLHPILLRSLNPFSASDGFPTARLGVPDDPPPKSLLPAA